ncbi:hypothetical protein ACS0TY_023365 [Phlomoides rotata]
MEIQAISDLLPYEDGWTIKVRVARKTSRETFFKNERKTDIVKLFLQDGEVDDCLESFPLKISKSFVPFNEVEKVSKGQRLMGMVIKVRQSFPVPLRGKDKTTMKREITLLDLTGGTIKLELWGDLATGEGDILESMIKPALNALFSSLSIQFPEFFKHYLLKLIVSDGIEEVYTTLFDAAEAMIGCPVNTFAEKMLTFTPHLIATVLFFIANPPRFNLNRQSIHAAATTSPIQSESRPCSHSKAFIDLLRVIPNQFATTRHL